VATWARSFPWRVPPENGHDCQYPLRPAAGGGLARRLGSTRHCFRFPWRRDQVKIDGQWKSVRFTPNTPSAGQSADRLDGSTGVRRAASPQSRCEPQAGPWSGGLKRCARDIAGCELSRICASVPGFHMRPCLEVCVVGEPISVVISGRSPLLLPNGPAAHRVADMRKSSARNDVRN
jgi:hypothetical protein